MVAIIKSIFKIIVVEITLLIIKRHIRKTVKKNKHGKGTSK